MQMQKMGTDGLPDNNRHDSDTKVVGSESTAFSGPLNKRGTRCNIPDDGGSSSSSGSVRSRDNEDYIEITLDVRDDSVAVHSLKTAGGADVENPELTLLEKKSSLGASTPTRIQRVSQELRKLTLLSEQRDADGFDRTKSATAQALKGLKFISKSDGAAGWTALEKRFDELTAPTSGLLPRALFGKCIGMNKDSREFAAELFDALSRRRYITGDFINKYQLKDFWEQIADQSFDTRLQTFFDMVDKDADGRITEDEVRKIIRLSASANNLPNIEKQADEYAALIMDELDPDELGYIMIESLENILLQGLTQSARGESKSQSMVLSHKLQHANDTNIIQQGAAPFDKAKSTSAHALSTSSMESKPSTSFSMESSQPCRIFEYHEILSATDNFDESLVIGHGGFGKVYKGNVINGSSLVVAAVKRLDSMSSQGESEFWAEVEMLSKFRHCNLVSLFGYCKYEKEMILIYEYMPNGTLEDHLHKLGTLLPWLQRLKICIGAARGLDYLHTGTGTESGVIHRDIKTSNILLHESWAAKISDFGLSKIGPINQPSTYVNTLVKGTFGYLDPNYFGTGKLTRKSDVYAFGVVLLEVLCRKHPLDRSLDEGLVTWAQDSIKEGNLKDITDSDIRGQISTKCLKEFVRIVERCLLNSPKQRPTMAEIVVNLDSVLTLQEKANYGSLQAGGKTMSYSANPILLYAGERLTRALRSNVKPINILKVMVYPGNLLALHMSKPQGFKYKSGQYMFLNCAAISSFEWHPFWISSAPGDDYLSVHIRTLGDWTRQLNTVFSQVCLPPANRKGGLLRAGFQGDNSNFPKVLIDGPYGTLAQDYKKYHVVLLVGLGIGASPMISIVKDIVNNMKEQEDEALKNGGNNRLPPESSLSKKNTSNLNTTRAYFYWVTREQGSFDWFKGVMNEVAETDQNGVIEMHKYCTSVYEEGDARSAVITMLQSLHHAKNGVDVVSGTRVKAHFGKPNWQSVTSVLLLLTAVNGSECSIVAHQHRSNI